MEEGRMGMEDGAGGEGWMMGRDECEGYGRGGGRWMDDKFPTP